MDCNINLQAQETKNLMHLFYKLCNDNNIISDNKKIFQYLYTFENKNNKQLSLLDLL